MFVSYKKPFFKIVRVSSGVCFSFVAERKNKKKVEKKILIFFLYSFFFCCFSLSSLRPAVYAITHYGHGPFTWRPDGFTSPLTVFLSLNFLSK